MHQFDTPVTLTGPLRTPAQMLATQEINGHASLHDDAIAADLGMAGAPIEGPTHLSQIDPLAAALWGRDWFERGCVSAHFRNMVIEGEQVQASLTRTGPTRASVEAHKPDGVPVLVGSATIGPNHGTTYLAARRAALPDPGRLLILEELRIGMRETGTTVSMGFYDHNGALYPFSLAQKLARITEPHPFYTAEGAIDSPWGRPIIPTEMVAVLAFKSGFTWPIHEPVIGLFLDLEIRILAGPLAQDEPYAVEREIVGLSQSRRTESCWTDTTLWDSSGSPAAAVLLHMGFLKETYAGYADGLPVADG